MTNREKLLKWADNAQKTAVVSTPKITPKASEPAKKVAETVFPAAKMANLMVDIAKGLGGQSTDQPTPSATPKVTLPDVSTRAVAFSPYTYNRVQAQVDAQKAKAKQEAEQQTKAISPTAITYQERRQAKDYADSRVETEKLIHQDTASYLADQEQQANDRVAAIDAEMAEVLKTQRNPTVAAGYGFDVPRNLGSDPVSLLSEEGRKRYNELKKQREEAAFTPEKRKQLERDLAWARYAAIMQSDEFKNWDPQKWQPGPDEDGVIHDPYNSYHANLELNGPQEFATEDEERLLDYLIFKNKTDHTWRENEHLTPIRYFQWWNENLGNPRAGKKMAEEAHEDGLLGGLRMVGDHAMRSMDDAWAGLFGIERPLTASDYAVGEYREGLDGLGRVAFDGAATIADMLPSVGASILTKDPALGLTIMSGSAGGRAVEQARRQGYGLAQSYGYGALNAASEAMLGRLLGGISAVGGGEGVFSNIAGKSAENISNGFLRFAAKVGLNSADEALEEYLQGVLDPVFRNLMLGENNEVKIISEDAAYDAFMALITTPFLEGPSQAMEEFSRSRAKLPAVEPSADGISPLTTFEGNPLLAGTLASMGQKTAIMEGGAQSDVSPMLKPMLEAQHPQGVRPIRMEAELPTDGQKTASTGEAADGKRAGPSAEATAVMDRLAKGEDVPLEEIYQIPEIAEVKKRPYSPTFEIDTPERNQLRRDVLDRLLAKGSYTGVAKDGDKGYNGPIKQERRADIVIGVPAAGKSSVLVNPLSKAHCSRVIDSDMDKELLPEYDGGKGAGDVHGESSAIRNALLAKAVSSSDNIVWPQVGGDLEALRADILALKADGYKVYLHLNELSASKAMGRAINRFETEGRYVDPGLILKIGDSPTRNYEILCKEGGLLDGYSRYSNDVPFGADPICIEDSERADRGGLRGDGARVQGDGKADGREDSPLRRADNRGLRGGPEDGLGSAPAGAVQTQGQERENGTEPAGVGAAARGFAVPGGLSQEMRTSQYLDSMGYNQNQGEATGLEREPYERRFKYRVQSEGESSQSAYEMLFYQQGDGQVAFVKDIDPAGYDQITAELREAPAWNAEMTDAAQYILSELRRRSIMGEGTQEEYARWQELVTEKGRETGRGIQANAKWSRRDNAGGRATETEAWEALQKMDLTEEERQSRFSAIVKFDMDIEAAKTDEDLRAVIMDIARERGVLDRAILPGESKIAVNLAEWGISALDSAELKQFAYASSAALVKDASRANVGEMMKTIQVLNMLSNPKTSNRNIAGNVTNGVLDKLALRAGALLDMAISNITGTRSLAMEGTVLSPDVVKSMIRSVQLSTAEVTLDVDMGGGNRANHDGTRTFRASGNAVERVMSMVERNMNYLMTAFTDEATKGTARAVEARTQKLIDKGKIKGASAGYAHDYAETLAKQRTFQDDSIAAKALTALHDFCNLVGIGDSGKEMFGKKVHSAGLGDLAMPFYKVPANIGTVAWGRMSPMNAIRGFYELGNVIIDAKVRGNQVDPAAQRKAVSNTTRGLTGTAILAGLTYLAACGFITRADDEDNKKVSQMNAANGLKGTQVNWSALGRWVESGFQEAPVMQQGDTLVDFSSIEPFNAFVDMGLNLSQVDVSDGFLSTLGSTGEALGNTAMHQLEDMPMMDTVSGLATDIIRYGENPWVALLTRPLKTAISSFTPNAMAQFAAGMDDKQRDLYASDDPAAQLLDYAKSRIPGLRETLPAKEDPATGEEKDNPGDFFQRIMRAIINPVGVNTYQGREFGGMTAEDWGRFFAEVDADGNKYRSKTEIMAWIDANIPEERRHEVFEAAKGNQNWKNPY